MRWEDNRRNTGSAASTAIIYLCTIAQEPDVMAKTEETSPYEVKDVLWWEYHKETLSMLMN